MRILVRMNAFDTDSLFDKIRLNPMQIMSNQLLIDNESWNGFIWWTLLYKAVAEECLFPAVMEDIIDIVSKSMLRLVIKRNFSGVA
jgi:hypothetical protein